MEKSNFGRTFFARIPPTHGTGLTIFWFLRVGAGATARNVRQKKTNAATSTQRRRINK